MKKIYDPPTPVEQPSWSDPAWSGPREAALTAHAPYFREAAVVPL